MSDPRSTTGASAAIVCVAIPVYRAALSENERISLRRCIQVLEKHPIVLVKPAALDLSSLDAEFPCLRTEPFADHYFEGVRGYNSLMLSPEFYRRFAAFDYVLIHQLDAFIFRDELLDWSLRGYDYIGAPWITHKALSSRAGECGLKFKRWLYERVDRRRPDTAVYPHYKRLLFRVGNGGLSLRRISAFLRVLEQFKAKAENAARSDPFLNEDQFFSIEVNHGRENLFVPDYRTASRFAVELCPRLSVERLNRGELPFGCHAWDKYETAFWFKHFSKLGYASPGY